MSYYKAYGARIQLYCFWNERLLNMENNIVGEEQVVYDAPQKSFIVTLLLNFFLGFLGIHRFYTGYIGIGIAQLLTFGGCGIWTLIDYIMIIANKYNDKEGRPLAEYNKQLAIGSLIVIIILSLACIIFN